MQLSNTPIINSRLLQLVAALFIISNLLLSGCSDNANSKQTKQEDPPGKVTLKDGLTPINKTRDHTLFAIVKGGDVVGWEIQDTEGNPVDITYKKETKKDTGTVKCLACIQKENDDGEEETKCWEIPCKSVPK